MHNAYNVYIMRLWLQVTDVTGFYSALHRGGERGRDWVFNGTSAQKQAIQCHL